jgi:hypothetical protein
MANTVWSASLQDDVSAVANKMGDNLLKLDKQVSNMFASSKGDFNAFSKALKAGGVSAVDAALMTSKYRKELVDARKEALGLGKAVESTGDKLRRMFREVGTGMLRGAGEKLLSAPGAMLSGAFGVVQKVGSIITDVGETFVGAVLDAAQFRQNAITGLEYMLGTREEAVAIFKQAQELATQTPLDTDKVISGVKQLVTAGFSGKESMVLFKAVADQAAKHSDDPQMVDKVIGAFARVKGRGFASGEDWESFQAAGFRREGVVQALMKNPKLAPAMKIKEGMTDEAKLKEVQRVISTGQVGVYTFLNAAIKSLEEGKSEIGTFAGEMGEKSLTGSISNVKSAFGDLLKSTDLDQWEGVKAFQKFLGVVTKALNPKNADGFLKVIERLTNSLLGGLGTITDSDVQGFLATLTVLGDKLVGFLKEAWGWFDKILHAEPGGFVDAIGGTLLEIAKYIGAGIWEGFKNAGSILEERKRKQKEASDKADADVSKRLSKDDFSEGIAALTEVSIANRRMLGEEITGSDVTAAAAMDFGAWAKESAAGVGELDIPHFGVGGIVNGPTLAVVGEAGPEAIVPLSGTQGRDYSMGLSGQGKGRGDIAVYVNVTGGADPEVTGQVIGREVRRELTRLLERTALEG